jgi:hypothetical protein
MNRESSSDEFSRFANFHVKKWTTRKSLPIRDEGSTSEACELEEAEIERGFAAAEECCHEFTNYR